AGGNAAFTETVSVTTSGLGLFNVKVGSQSSGITGVNWLNGPWFLAVAVDTSSSGDFVDMGAQEVVSVPYAMNAGYAEDVISSYTNNVLSIGNTSYTLDPPVLYSGG